MTINDHFNREKSKFQSYIIFKFFKMCHLIEIKGILILLGEFLLN